MEKQRDKAAKRLQRKLQRQSGVPLPDDGTAGEETDAGELVEAAEEHPGTAE
ncbi:MAG: hypothetical protein ABSH49_27195 [Bryobacteraceae bacterium]|jgi:hypothetical protein